MTLFADFIEKSMKVFMDDFSFFGKSFHKYLHNLEQVLERYEEINLILNLEKFHFIVKEGIVLGHKVSKEGSEVDKAKTDVIEKLPPHTNIKGVRCFLEHVDFYRKFIKDFSEISSPCANYCNTM